MDGGKTVGSKCATSGMSKTEIVLKKLRSARCATIAQLGAATGWQAHSVRGFLSVSCARSSACPCRARSAKTARAAIALLSTSDLAAVIMVMKLDDEVEQLGWMTGGRTRRTMVSSLWLFAADRRPPRVAGVCGRLAHSCQTVGRTLR